MIYLLLVWMVIQNIMGLALLQALVQEADNFANISTGEVLKMLTIVSLSLVFLLLLVAFDHGVNNVYKYWRPGRTYKYKPR